VLTNGSIVDGANVLPNSGKNLNKAAELDGSARI